LGTVNAVQSRLVVLAINNAGTVELAVVNITGGNDLSETGVINTTTIAAASNTANVIYSTTGRTGVSYRVVGYVESTQATAGTWATAPSTIQGAGGNALTGMNGQTWQDMTASRALGTTYTNTTPKEIEIFITLNVNSASNATLTLNGISTGASAIYANTASTSSLPISFRIPSGNTYLLAISSGTPSINKWLEKR
jgi:hypothetical protein